MKTERGITINYNILAGYKPYLWVDDFSRLVKFLPNDMDVYIILKLFNKVELVYRMNEDMYITE